jgi:hypothetical protein
MGKHQYGKSEKKYKVGEAARDYVIHIPLTDSEKSSIFDMDPELRRQLLNKMWLSLPSIFISSMYPSPPSLSSLAQLSLLSPSFPIFTL